jgi:hypothetical protein
VQPPDLAPNLLVAEQLREAFGGAKVAASAVAEEASLGDPTGWANLKGKIRLTESIASTQKPVEKDVHVCGTKAPNEEVVCGPDNGLKNVLIFLSTALPSETAPWVHDSYQASATSEVEFDQKNCIFLSHVFALRATQKLKVINSDKVGHNTNIPDFNYNRIIPELASDNSATVKATKRPSMVSCSIHPWMTAYVFASKSPYFAVTNESGEFEMKNLPAGVDLEFTVWQEKIGYPKEAKVNNENQQWKQGKIVLKLDNESDKILDIVLDAAKFR